MAILEPLKTLSVPQLEELKKANQAYSSAKTDADRSY